MTRGGRPLMQGRVNGLRIIINGHLPMACMLLMLTLCMKVLVPVGFMPDLSAGRIELVMCDGMATTKTTPVAMHGMHGHHHHGHDGPVKSDAPCPFAGLTAPVLGGADPIQLAIALVDILIAGLLVDTAIGLRAVDRLRPPLRGPPAIA